MSFEFKHGGSTKRPANASPLEADDGVSPFDYLFPDAAADANCKLPSADTALTTNQLKTLGQFMADLPAASAVNSIIPPVYTYWGQFIDHDLTANTDRDGEVSNIRKEVIDPLEPDFVKTNLGNLRKPKFDLDSLYGDGPTLDAGAQTKAAEFYDGIKFKMGVNHSVGVLGEQIPSIGDLSRDLPRRDDKSPIIGDSRNDENLIVAQFHLMLMRFHNSVVDWVSANDPQDSDAKTFVRAQDLVRWHYQWLCIHDYLKTITVQGIVDRKLFDGTDFYEKRNGELFMPLEFSVAAFRFGHTMVRAEYDFNRNFGSSVPPANSLLSTAPFNLMFEFTGKGGFPNPPDSPTLPFNWIIEWDRFVHKGTSDPLRFARKIDTHLALPLSNMQNEIDEDAMNLPMPLQQLIAHLAMRNLLRGYLLSIPTGQCLAEQFAIEPLTAEELNRDNPSEIAALMETAGFLEKTPAWYYILKESEVRENGNSLGETGSQIIAETFVGIMTEDDSSFLNKDFDPSEGVKFDDGSSLVTISDMIRFAGLEV